MTDVIHRSSDTASARMSPVHPLSASAHAVRANSTSACPPPTFDLALPPTDSSAATCREGCAACLVSPPNLPTSTGTLMCTDVPHLSPRWGYFHRVSRALCAHASSVPHAMRHTGPGKGCAGRHACYLAIWLCALVLVLVVHVSCAPTLHTHTRPSSALLVAAVSVFHALLCIN